MKEEEKIPEKGLQERVDFLENDVRILRDKIAALSRRINSSERSSNSQVDIW